MSSQPSSDYSACPRCGQPFHCGVADARCDCFEVQLTPGLREQLAAQYSSCLCVSCLKQLKDQAAAAQQ